MDTNVTDMAMRPAGAALTLEALGGVWRRSLLQEPDGSRDTSSQVYWLQFGTFCGDIRIPGDGPAAPGAMAFAGNLRQRGDIFHWDPDWDFGIPADAPPDEGYLRWEGDILREDGVHIAYLEHWHRLAEPEKGDFGCYLRDCVGDRAGLFIRIGQFAFAAWKPADRNAPAFLLAIQDQELWQVAAMLPAQPFSGDKLTWPELLQAIGIDGEAAPAVSGHFTPSQSLSMDFDTQGVHR
ncbi:hypothetical protein V6C03_07320 [Methyloligella sp. 2.7D]|uniref:hypothetical protein n=1 Tax=unclassified Methyloligella TaxID=2625955 RepID=UPI00157DA8B6|nr:hypothetical protein [Methyloligella sp. GL2]QKP78301.1 hypothetical protein HT051_13125 [Methyloligella sp. GL2]